MILVFPGRPIFHQRNNVRECNETRYLVFFSSFFVVSWGRGREDTRNPPEKELNSGGFRAERVEDLEKGEPESRISRCMAVMQEDREKTYVWGSSAKNNAHVGPR